MQSSKLPIEVCERIIDCIPYPDYIPLSWESPSFDLIYESTRALRASALVCRSWVPRSQQHLFRHVQLRYTRQAHAFIEIVCQTPAMAQSVRVLSICPLASLDVTPDLFTVRPDRPPWTEV